MLHLVKLIELKETEALDELIILFLLTDGVKTQCYSIWKFNWKKEKKTLKPVELKNAPGFFYYYLFLQQLRCICWLPLLLFRSISDAESHTSFADFKYLSAI